MSTSHRVLYWTPRIVCILLIAFVSMFALDVFAEGRGFWETLVALFMHLIPSLVMAAALAVAWRYEWFGAGMFTLCGVFFLLIVRGNWWVKGIFVLPCIVVALLFFFNWRLHQHAKHP